MMKTTEGITVLKKVGELRKKFDMKGDLDGHEIFVIKTTDETTANVVVDYSCLNVMVSCGHCNRPLVIPNYGDNKQLADMICHAAKLMIFMYME